QPGPPLRSVRQDLVEPEPAHRPERGGDMAVRQRAGDREALFAERNEPLPGQHPPQALDLGLRPIGDVGERARLNLALFAIALTKQHGRRRIAVREARHVHDQLESPPRSEVKHYLTCLQNRRKTPQSSTNPHLPALPLSEVRSKTTSVNTMSALCRNGLYIL